MLKVVYVQKNSCDYPWKTIYSTLPSTFGILIKRVIWEVTKIYSHYMFEQERPKKSRQNKK